MRTQCTLLAVAAAGLSILLGGGCAVPRMEVRTALDAMDAELPAAWSAAADRTGSPMTTHFLELIDDPRLTELVGQALRANPDLRAVAHRLAAAFELLAETRSPRVPTVDAGLAVARGNHGFDDLGERGVETSQRVSLNGTWDVDIWRRLADLDRANHDLVRAQAADYAAARDALGARIVQVWVFTISLQRALDVELDRIEVLRQLQDTIRRRYRHGIGDLGDLAAARASTELAGARVADLREEYDRSLRSLEMLVGRLPRAELLVAETLPRLHRARTGCPATVLARRPDVAAALHRLEAADSTAAAAAKAMLPGLSLTGSMARDGAALSDLLRATTVWSVIGSVTRPVFTRGLLKARASARARELEAAWEEYRSVILRALGDVENGLGRERSLLEQRDYLTRAFDESVRSTRIQEDRYRRGLSGILELLAARDQQMDTRRRVIAAEGELLSNRVALALAVGARFEERKG